MPTPKVRIFTLAFLIGSLGSKCLPGQAIGQTSTARVSVAPQDLDASSLVILQPGVPFRISVPLRPSKAVNLGAARLDVTLSPRAKSKKAQSELHLVAVMPAAQTSLSAGEESVLLHGVVPNFDPARSGEYYPSDYNVHLGSGNVTNIGTPDDTLIDTERLTKKLQELRLRLVAAH